MGLFDVITHVVEKAKDTVVDTAKATVNTANDAVNTAVDVTGDTVNKAIDGVNDAGKAVDGVATNVGNAVGKAAVDAANEAADVTVQTGEGFAIVPGACVQATKEMIDEGVKPALNEVKKTAEASVEAGKDGVDVVTKVVDANT